MQAIFNEISALQLAEMSEEQATELVLNLIQVCKHLQAIETPFTMRINEHFWNIQLDDCGTILEFLEKNDDLKDELSFLRIITDSPYLPSEDVDIDTDKFLDENLVWRTVAVDADSGIRVAYAFYPKPVPVISFATDIWQNVNFIDVKPSVRPIAKLMNIATTKQIFEIHFETLVLEHLEIETANPTSPRVDTILPNKDITNTYVDYAQIYTVRKEGKTLNSSIPIKTLKTIGGVIAKINGWIRHNEYSRINKREVFHHHRSKTIFITIDTEKGDFEVHNSDKNKNHLGAISFDGAKIEPPKGHKLKFEHGD
jgi:hypothetical protein